MLQFCLPLALIAFIFGSTFVSAQSAQLLTLQTAAFGNAEQAEAVVSQLRTGGFDAYGEPSGEITRVRVGCFLDRASAEDVASTLAQQSDVQVVPLNAGARVTFCVRREAGFFLPAAWGVAQNTPQSITFWVDVAGRRYLRFDERGWRVYQDASAAVVSGPVSSVAKEGVSTPIRVNSLFVGSGQPLWRSADDERQTLVVQGEASVFTLTLLSPDELSPENTSLGERSE